MEKLIFIIEELRSRIKDHRDILSLHETRTRLSLIDPLLCALDWKVFDPNLVTPEYHYQSDSGWADYALLTDDGKPCLILEAKKLGHTLNAKDQGQMLKYAIKDGIPYAGLTNGDCWELYDVFKPVPLAEKKILDISIQNDPPHHCALNLLSLWRSNLSSDTITKASPPIIWPDQVDPPSLPEWESLAKHILDTKNLPYLVRFWDESETQLSSIKDLLRKIAEILVKQDVLTKNDLPYPPHRKTFCINTKPTYSDGKPFTKKDSVPISGTSIYLGCALGTSQIQKYSEKLLKDFGKNPSMDVLFNVSNDRTESK